jgi:hypothetical protein
MSRGRLVLPASAGRMCSNVAISAYETNSLCSIVRVRINRNMRTGVRAGSGGFLSDGHPDGKGL